jgi:hypothetical protein
MREGSQEWLVRHGDHLKIDLKKTGIPFCGDAFFIDEAS